MNKLVILCFIYCTGLYQASAYTINVVETISDSRYQQALQNYFTLVYKGIGIEPAFVYMPSERGLARVNRGQIDAEALRFESIGSLYPNLIKISTPVTTVYPALFCLAEIHCRDNTDAVFGVHRGFESAKAFCAELAGTCKFESTILSLAKLLDKGMVSALFLARGESGQVICELSADKIYHLEQPAFKRPSLHYVHNKHKALVPQLNMAIKEVNVKHSLDVSTKRLQGILGDCGKTLQNVSLGVTRSI